MEYNSYKIEENERYIQTIKEDIKSIRIHNDELYKTLDSILFKGDQAFLIVPFALILALPMSLLVSILPSEIATGAAYFTVGTFFATLVSIPTYVIFKSKNIKNIISKNNDEINEKETSILGIREKNKEITAEIKKEVEDKKEQFRRNELRDEMINNYSESYKKDYIKVRKLIK